MADRLQPQVFVWDGINMVPLNPFTADRQYVIGEKYILQPHEERDMVSHRGFFASIDEAYGNLPDYLARHFLHRRHFRKYCLIKAGWCSIREIVFETERDARIGAVLARSSDPLSIAIPQGNVLAIFTAKSISIPSANRDEFEDIKRRAVNIAASMIDVTEDELVQNTGGAL